MYILFLDNSYIDNSKNNLTALGGFLIKDQEYSNLREKFENIKIGNGLHPTDPVKWSPPQGDKRFKAQRELKNQNKLKQEVLQLIGNSNIKIICSFISYDLNHYRQLKQDHKISKNELLGITFDYEKRALEYLAQRFQLDLQEVAKNNGNREKGLIIIEWLDSKKSPLLIEYYKNLWHTGSGEFNMKFNLLFDSVAYSHDFGCDGIQMADFIIGSMCDSIKNLRYQYINLYKNKIRRSGKIVKGRGIVVYPSNSTFADRLISQVQA